MTCNAATPLLSEEEIAAKLSRMNGWSRGEKWIEKEYQFKNFLRAMSFVNAVAYVSESLNHHPDIMIHYNTVLVRNWTHAAGGVTKYDFELAAKIEEFMKEATGP